MLTKMVSVTLVTIVMTQIRIKFAAMMTIAQLLPTLIRPMQMQMDREMLATIARIRTMITFVTQMIIAQL
jgi:hypothetical protein